jgi:hypothetical protein
MQIELPELTAPATLILAREDRLTDDEYFAFCVTNPDLNVERTVWADSAVSVAGWLGTFTRRGLGFE